MSGNKNQVTLTIAGESTPVQQAFDRVGQGAQKMSDEVGKAGEGFEKADKAAGSLERAGRGLRDAFTGTTDTMKGVGGLLRGDFSADTFLTVGAGVADLGGAVGDLVIPLAQATAGFVAHTAATVAHTAAAGLAKAATTTWTGVQWLLNAALTANPIGIVVVAIGALIAIVVLIATKTTWFQDLWRVTWTFVKDKAVEVWDWLKSLPDKIGGVFSSIAGFVSAPFRNAFNFVADAWNNTIGGLHWKAPDFLGGWEVSVPQLRKFHSGGVVPGPPGSEMLGVLQAGEQISPAGALTRIVLELRSSGSRIDDLLVEILAGAIGARGGNVQVVLGR